MVTYARFRLTMVCNIEMGNTCLELCTLSKFCFHVPGWQFPGSVMCGAIDCDIITRTWVQDGRDWTYEWRSYFGHTVYPKKNAHGFVVLCFVVVIQSFIMNSHEVFIHIHQGSFAGTGAIVRLPQCQWSKPDGYGKISQCITTTKHSKAKTVCIFMGYTVTNEWRNMLCNK